MAATIRRATRNDSDALGRLGAMLMRTHYEFDPQRFLQPAESAERGYGSFLTSVIDSEDTCVFVAETEGTIVGYVYAGLEPMSWNSRHPRHQRGSRNRSRRITHERRDGLAARARCATRHSLDRRAERNGAAPVPKARLSRNHDRDDARDWGVGFWGFGF